MDNKLTSLPPQLAGLENLRRLDLADNRLNSLPKEIGELKNLRELKLEDNQLTALPEEIGNLSRLTHLNLRKNKLAELPRGIGGLKSLIELRLSDNQLTSLPPEIGALQNLTWLGAPRNKLKSLPAEIGSLTNLVTLRLFGNKLDHLPSTIGWLSNLKALYLNENRLRDLPRELVRLEKLEVLMLHKNRLRLPPRILGPPWNVADIGPQAPAKPGEILAYYFRSGRRVSKTRVARGFLSYAHADGDAGHLGPLRLYLGQLEQQKFIKFWSDEKLSPGLPWEPAILDKLVKADIILLVLSKAAMDSEFIQMKELAIAISRAKSKLCEILWVPLDGKKYNKKDPLVQELLKMTSATPKAKPIFSFRPHELGWLKVVDAIKAAIKRRGKLKE
jgi:Leucine-rich repeat (LRR) protein